MATSVTKGATTLYPLMVTTFAATRAPRTVLHELIGRAEPDVTLRESAPRSGTLQFLVSTLAKAAAIEALHGDDPAPMTVVDSTLGTMRYVVAGPVVLAPAHAAGRYWTVDVDYQVVTL